MALRITSELVKFKNLKARLGVPSYAVLGILESLWHFTAKNAIRGDVGRYSNQEIAAWIEWEGDADKLIEALTECRWLDSHPDHRLIVHDWHQHADKSVKTIMRNRKVEFAVAVNVAVIPKEISGTPEIPIGSPPECRVQSAGAGPESGVQGQSPAGSDESTKADAAELAGQFWNQIPGRRRPFLDELTEHFHAKLVWISASMPQDYRSLVDKIRRHILSSARDRTKADTVAKMFKFWQECGIDDASGTDQKQTNSATARRSIPGGDAWGDADKYTGSRVKTLRFGDANIGGEGQGEPPVQASESA